MQLHHWEPNGVFLKPLVALHEKGAAFESRWFDAPALEQVAPGFPADAESALQLEREGPLLQDGDVLISSSFFMLEYIAESVPGPELRPADAYARYRMRAWGQRIALGVAPVVTALGCARYLVPRLDSLRNPLWLARLGAMEPSERRERWLALLDERSGETALAPLRESLRGPLAKIEAELAGSAWLAGDAYSIADIDAYAMLSPLPDLAPALVNAAATPRILDFLQRVVERPAVRAARAMARTPHPEHCFVPGAEVSRWG